MTHSVGNGHLANTPLSMHSEMMAISSALSLSSTRSLPAPAALPRCCENRVLSYRVVVNDSYGDEPLKRTTTLSSIGSRALLGAPSLTARSGPPSTTVGRRRVRGRVLKPLHLNAVKGKKEGKKQKNQEKNVRMPPKTSIEKEREKTRHGDYHSSTSYRQAHHYHPTLLQPHQERHRPGQQEQQRRAHGIRDDQYGNDVADTAMSSHPVTHGICNSRRSPAQR